MNASAAKHRRVGYCCRCCCCAVLLPLRPESPPHAKMLRGVRIVRRSTCHSSPNLAPISLGGGVISITDESMWPYTVHAVRIRVWHGQPIFYQVPIHGKNAKICTRCISPNPFHEPNARKRGNQTYTSTSSAMRCGDINSCLCFVYVRTAVPFGHCPWLTTKLFLVLLVIAEEIVSFSAIKLFPALFIH